MCIRFKCLLTLHFVAAGGIMSTARPELLYPCISRPSLGSRLLRVESNVRPKKNMCVYYLMKISNRVGRSIFFTGFFFHYVPSNNANYLVCFVLYDPSLDQRILRKEEENILKLKIKLIHWFIL